MKRAYKAVLHGDRVEWLGSAPEVEGPVPVYITISNLSGSENSNDAGEKVTALEALQALADMGAFADIEDPVAWQREQRKDRPLPFRDCDVA